LSKSDAEKSEHEWALSCQLNFTAHWLLVKVMTIVSVSFAESRFNWKNLESNFFA